MKQVAAVKLVGYTLVNKRAVGLQNQHEMQSDDASLPVVSSHVPRAQSMQNAADEAPAVVLYLPAKHPIQSLA